MKLKNSKLCINCEALYEDPGPCPDCASKVFLWLFPVLGTTLQERAVKNQNYEPMPKDNIPQLEFFLENPLLFLGKLIPRKTRFLSLFSNIFVKGSGRITRGLDFFNAQIQWAKERTGLRLQK